MRKITKTVKDIRHGSKEDPNNMMRPNNGRFPRLLQALHGGKERHDAKECSFYITNFPESWKSKDLTVVFAKLGNVKDVLAPDKRNKIR